MRAAQVLVLVAHIGHVGHVASAGELCSANAVHHGAALDLDLVHADLHDALRLLADTAKLGLVVGQDVSGSVTVKLKRVPWDAAMCTIAGLHHLRITLDHGILLVRKS